MKRSRTIFLNHLSGKKIKHIASISQTIKHVLKSGVYFYGKQNKRLAETLTTLFGTHGYTTLVASGHDALILSLLSLQLHEHDEVLFPVNAYPTIFPIALSGLMPVPVDVDQNGQMDPEAVIKRITPRTKAIIIVHLYGLVGNLRRLLQIARERGLFVIEDCAQSFGTRFENQLTGTFGGIGCFSFYPTKNIGTAGDGGAIYTPHKNYYQFIRQAQAYGEDKRYYSQMVSGHSRMPEIQAAIVNIHLTKSTTEFGRRKEIFKWYHELLGRRNIDHNVRLLVSHPLSDPVHHLLACSVHQRDKLRLFLHDHKIQTGIHYSYPTHLVPSFSFLGYKRGDFPVAEKLASSIISLPFHPYLSKRDVGRVVNNITQFYMKHGR